MNWMGRCFVVALGVGASVAYGQEVQEEPAEETDPTPAVIVMQRPAMTKLEAFDQAQGVVLTRGYTRVGAIGSDDGATLNIYSVAISDSAGAKVLGMAIEVVQQNRRAAWTYIDEDEIKPLLDALQVISRVDKNSTLLDNTEARYRTRGGLQVTNRDANGSRMLAVRAVGYLPLTGQVNWARAQFRVARLSELERQLTLAREVLNRLKNDDGK